MRNTTLWLPVLLAGSLVAGPAMAAGPTPQTVQKDNPNGSTAGLFPKNQPAQHYSVSGANNEQAGMTAHGYEPNAGATGLNGSAGASNGWSGSQSGTATQH
jgi:hypothetical protein